ncbi:hypothetical protein ACN2WE_05740 [Streptomyces sp. cg28]|uniref:hypothetical protein n=1 Tax=Streptomyces sp. cg28 TaxID=3403457 RepID=UPI003B2260CF
MRRALFPGSGPDGLRVFHASCAKALSFDLAEAAETGRHCARSQLAWIRRHKKEAHFEFGFVDGSWATVHVPDHEAVTHRVAGILPAGGDRP